MSKFISSLILLLLLPSFCQAQLALPALNDVELKWLGEQIFRNECNSKPECLTAWNQGENFPSLGIGHFIWYQAGQLEGFTETFPDLLNFLQAQGQALPEWLVESNFEQPWPDRDSFLAAANTEDLLSLRSFLLNNIPLQTAFIVQRFETGLSKVLSSATDTDEGKALAAKITLLTSADQSHGLYALIDYIHFKGEGVNIEERYLDQGWGLLQVLQEMPANSAQPIQDFVSAADRVLSRRVANAPPARNESRWLAGWQNRLKTYLLQE